ncbi:MAG: DUF805 domain-containing protein [Patescibacteria group bacterium]|nr:DUF805 domain-containing protein [Patescibacteria group bacterium]
MNWYIKVLKKYAVFSGRARRKEYWMFVLFNVIFAIIASIIDSIIGIKVYRFGLIYILYILAVLIPSLAVGVRRLHDTGRSGWWLLLALAPTIASTIIIISALIFGLVSVIGLAIGIGFVAIIGFIWFIVLMALNGNPGDNKYGPDPKAVVAAAIPQAQS